VTIRFPNSISEWNWSGGVRWVFVHVGQSEHPSPEPVTRTAAPVSTIAATATREARESRRSVEGATERSRRTRAVAASTGERTPVDGSGDLRGHVGGLVTVEQRREGEETARAREVRRLVVVGFPGRCQLRATTSRERRRGDGDPA
jgi:hypothetical protein